MNKKEYIKPYKIYYLKCYLDFIEAFDTYNYAVLNHRYYDDNRIKHLKEHLFYKIEDMFCNVQIGSFTNQYRVGLIKDFEKKLIERVLKKVNSLINQELINSYFIILTKKLRKDLLECL